MSSLGLDYRKIDYVINYRRGTEKKHVCIVYFSDYQTSLRDISFRNRSFEALSYMAKNKIDEFHLRQERKAGMPKFILENLIRDDGGEINTRLLHGLNSNFRRLKFRDPHDYLKFIQSFDISINKKWKKITKIMINHGKDSASMSYRGISLKAPSI